MVLKHLNRIGEGQKHQQGTAIYMLEVLKTQFDSYYYSHSTDKFLIDCPSVQSLISSSA
jgi:hypothetical protein